MDQQAGKASCCAELRDPRWMGETLLQLADTKEMLVKVMGNYHDALPYAAIGKAVTTECRSVSLRNALDIVREIKHIPLVDFCALLRACGWVKLTTHDNTHRPTKAAVVAGYVERVYYRGTGAISPQSLPPEWKSSSMLSEQANLTS